MTKLVLVETASIFRHLYAIEVADSDPIEYALDDVVVYATSDENVLTEMAQHHVSEDVFSYREITEDEYLKIFNKENDYLSEWTDEQKKKFIFRKAK